MERGSLRCTTCACILRIDRQKFAIVTTACRLALYRKLQTRSPSQKGDRFYVRGLGKKVEGVDAV